MSPSLLDRAVDLMLYGMGAVFLFLGVLIAVTAMVSWLVQKFGPPPVSGEVRQPGNALHQAAVSAAVHHHRRKNS